MTDKDKNMTPGASDGFISDETELEMSAIRRGMWIDESMEVVPPKKRNAITGDKTSDDDALTMTGVDLTPAGTSGRRPEQKAAAAKMRALSGADNGESSGVGSAQPASGKRTKSWRWQILVIAITVLGLAGMAVIGIQAAQPSPEPETVPLVTSMNKLCPMDESMASSIRAVSMDGQVRARAIADPQFVSYDGELSKDDAGQPVVISPGNAQSAVAGGSLINKGQQLWWGECKAPRDDQYVHLPTGDGARLLVANPEPEDALIDITLTSKDGELSADELRSVTVPADSQRIINLSSIVGDVDGLGIRVRASLGRVTVTGQIVGKDGGDFANATIQNDELIIPAIPAGTKKVRLLMTNPGTSRTNVRIEALSDAGRFALPGFEKVSLNPQRTTSVDVSQPISELPVALVITAADAIAVSAFFESRADFGITQALPADDSALGQELIGMVPGQGALQLANPGSDQAAATIDWADSSSPTTTYVPAGGMISMPVPSDAKSVRVSADAQITGAVVANGDGRRGFTIAELEAVTSQASNVRVLLDPGLG